MKHNKTSVSSDKSAIDETFKNIAGGDQDDDEDEIDRQDNLLVKESQTQGTELKAEIVQVKDVPAQDFVMAGYIDPNDATDYDNESDDDIFIK